MFKHILGYLKDRNAAAHSADSDIFHAVIHINLFKVVSSRGESVLVCNNFMHDDASMARCGKGIVTTKHLVI